jgi:flagellar protein FlaJ
MKLIVFLLLAVGFVWYSSSRISYVYRPAAVALRKRAPKPPNLTERITNRFSHKILPLVSIDDPAKYNHLNDALKNLNSNDSPELYQAKAISKACILAAPIGMIAIPISVFIGAALTGIVFAMGYKSEMKRVNKQLHERRQKIERELPQLSSTISQSLMSTKDVASILSSYRKVCAPVLAEEIQHTLNDMVTGNPERALKALEGRINSPQLSQITRGLISVLHGEEQSIYFQVLSSEFRKAQDEEVTRELEKRPAKLLPNMGYLFVCFVLMIIAGLGTTIAHQMGTFFN